MTQADLRALAERVEAGEDDIIETWRAVECALGKDYAHVQGALLDDSLDAALALKERVLPGWWWDVEYHQGDAIARVADLTDPADDRTIFAEASTPARALVAVVLRARAEMEPG